MTEQSTLDHRREAMLQRVRGEFREMPGLNLTARQACRLWQISLSDCNQILEHLVDEHFLRRTTTGSFVAVGAGNPARQAGDDGAGLAESTAAASIRDPT